MSPSRFLYFLSLVVFLFFFFTYTAPPHVHPLSLHDALPISRSAAAAPGLRRAGPSAPTAKRPCPRSPRSEEHTSELQSLRHLVCRLLLEKKKTTANEKTIQ